MNILILKTNINSKEDFESVKNKFDRKEMRECTIDLGDVDKVFRVVSEKITIDEVEEKIRALGFSCNELPD